MDSARPGVVLSDRECQVLVRVARGETTDAIAHALGISTHTVKKHVSLTMAKLRCKSRPAAIAEAFALGILTADDLRGGQSVAIALVAHRSQTSNGHLRRGS